MKCKYQIPIERLSVFDGIEKQHNVKIPDSFKNLMIEANAATPEKCRFMLNGEERVLGNMLSFNKKTADTDSAEDAFSAIQNKNLLPFAIDPFGNYICFSTENDTVVVREHETDETISTDLNLSDFLSSLYIKSLMAFIFVYERGKASNASCILYSFMVL